MDFLYIYLIEKKKKKKLGINYFRIAAAVLL